MKIIVSHVYSSDNKGDAALVSVLLDDIERQFPGSEVTILTLEEVDTSKPYEGAKQHPSFIYHAFNTFSYRPMKLIYSFFIVILTLFWALVYRYFNVKLYLPQKLRSIADIYLQTDLIIPVGGGYVRSGRSFASSVSLFLLLHPLLFGYLLRKPTVLYTQSIGPFYRSIERLAVAFVLKRMNLIILREEISKKLLQNLGVKNNVVRSVDSGFAFKSKKSAQLRKKIGISKDQLLIGVTVRKWLDPIAQAHYETAIAHIVDYVTSKYNASVVFIPQVTSTFHSDDDRQASQDVYLKLQDKANAYVITDNLTHYEVKAMYDELDLIIGTRFHSVIFSLTSYVPAFAIEYEHKTSGIMNDLDLSEWVVKIESLDTTMMERKIDALVAERVTYVKHLHQVIPQYITQAHQAIELTNNAYKKSLSMMRAGR